jgi:acyl-CoA dehydrogenase-like protein
MKDARFTRDQLELRDGARDVLKDLDGQDPALVWARLVDLGLPSALVTGLNELDVVLCLEETGRAALPVPIVETCLVAGHLRPGDPRRFGAVLDGSGLLPWPDQAEAALVGDATGVWLLENPAPESLPAVDPQRPLGRIAPDQLPGPDGGEPLAVDAQTLARARRAGALGTAAQLLGLAGYALDLTVGYVRERRQFGVPVGSFQAVKHQLADAHLALEMARPLVYQAAWAQTHDVPAAGREVAAAKARASEAAALVARASLQCHGAMGYTREYPLHRWLTRIWALRAAWGTPTEHRAALAAELGLTGGTR